jgi:hypothetical protein
MRGEANRLAGAPGAPGAARNSAATQG